MKYQMRVLQGLKLAAVLAVALSMGACANKNLGADGYSDQRPAAVGVVPFAGRQNRGHDHRTGMHRTALEGIVKVLAMRRGAIDEGRP